MNTRIIAIKFCLELAANQFNRITILIDKVLLGNNINNVLVRVGNSCVTWC